MLTTILPLLLGIGAWGCAAAALILGRKEFCVPSCLLCAWALFFPLLQIDQWVMKNDVSAILDVTRGYLIAAAALLTVNTALTALCYLIRRK